MATREATCSSISRCSWPPTRTSRSPSRPQLGGCSGGQAGGLSDPRRDDREPVGSRRGHRALAQAARLRPLPGPRAVARVHRTAPGLSCRTGFGFNWPGHAVSAAYRTLSPITIGAVATAWPRPPTRPSSRWPRRAASSSPVGSGRRARPPRPPACPPRAELPLPAIEPRCAGVEHRHGRGDRRGRAGCGGRRSAFRLGASADVARAAPCAGRWRSLGESPPRPGWRRRRARADRLAGHRPERSPGSQPEPRPRHPAQRPAPHVHADRPVRPAGLAATRSAGKVVLLAFNDSECTTIARSRPPRCWTPRQKLGVRGTRSSCLASTPTPRRPRSSDVSSYSSSTGCSTPGTSSRDRCRSWSGCWKAYRIEAGDPRRPDRSHPGAVRDRPPGAAVEALRHPAVLRRRRAARPAARAMELAPAPRAPPCTQIDYSRIAGIGPTRAITLPRAGGGSVAARPGSIRACTSSSPRGTGRPRRSPRALRTSTAIPSAPRQRGSPRSRPWTKRASNSPGALAKFLGTLPHPLAYPVAVDQRDGSPTATRSRAFRGSSSCQARAGSRGTTR